MNKVLTEIDAGVGIVTLNRPDRRNTFDDEIIVALTDALENVGEDPAVRVVVLSAAGSSFCAGADLHWMKRAATYSEQENLRDAQALARLLRTLNELPKPTVARVHGSAYGGGVGLIAACDIALGVFEAHFSLSEVKLGLIPAVISPYVIAAIGARKARRFMLSAETFSASEAYRMGLLHEIVADEVALDEAVGETVDTLLAGGPSAQAECKSLVAAVAGRSIDDDLIDETARRITRVRAGAEAREGMAAFFERRAPIWSGEPKKS
jgi:methylglutaconyl-CoA hydratase